MVSGTPTDGGSFPVTVTVSDGESPAQTAAAVLTLVVDDPSSSPTSASPSPSPSLSTDDGGSPDAIAPGSGGASGLSITITALPEGTVGDGYIAAATATGGDGTYTWSASGLPAGLRINSRTGTISGAPTMSGNFQVDLKVSVGGSRLRSSSFRLSLTINSGAPSPDPGSS